MKKAFLLGTVSFLALGSAALAADLPRKGPTAAPIYPPPMASWAGCYLGASVGAVHHNQTGNFLNPDGPDPFDFGKTGGIYGGYLGCNWQNRSFVYGIEGDFNGLSGTSGTAIPIQDTDYGPFSAKMNWFGTIRGRAGLAVDNAMIYLTGGVAFANIKTSLIAVNSDQGSFSSSDTRVGWTVGAGVEYMFTPNWIGRVEMLYAAFDNNGVNFPATFSGSPFGYTSHLSNELMIGRVGLAYKW